MRKEATGNTWKRCDSSKHTSQESCREHTGPCHHISLESPEHKDGFSAFNVAEVLFSVPSVQLSQRQ